MYKKPENWSPQVNTNSQTFYIFYNSLYMTLFLLAIKVCVIIRIVEFNNSFKG